MGEYIKLPEDVARGFRNDDPMKQFYFIEALNNLSISKYVDFPKVSFTSEC